MKVCFSRIVLFMFEEVGLGISDSRIEYTVRRTIDVTPEKMRISNFEMCESHHC